MNLEIQQKIYLPIIVPKGPIVTVRINSQNDLFDIVSLFYLFYTHFYYYIQS